MSTRQKKDDATHRLEDMTTQEVSLVDRAANLRTFLTLKSEDNGTMAKKKTDTNKQALVLPTQAKEALVEGVADALEKLTGVTQAIKESTTDDAAEVPAELPQMIKEASELLSKVASKFMPGDSSSSSDSDSDVDAETQKAKDALAKFAETMKGRRMTASRENQMKEVASAFAALGDALGVDLKGVFAPASDNNDDASETEKSAHLEVLTSLVDAINGINAKVDALAKSDPKPNPAVDSLTEQVAALKKAIEAPGESNSVGAEGGEPPKEKPFQWPTDFADHVAKKRAAGT